MIQKMFLLVVLALLVSVTTATELENENQYTLAEPTASFEAFLKDHGRETITKIVVHRASLGKKEDLLNLLTRGDWENKVNSMGYDTMYYCCLNFNINRIGIIFLFKLLLQVIRNIALKKFRLYKLNLGKLVLLMSWKH